MASQAGPCVHQAGCAIRPQGPCLSDRFSLLRPPHTHAAPRTACPLAGYTRALLHAHRASVATAGAQGQARTRPSARLILPRSLAERGQARVAGQGRGLRSTVSAASWGGLRTGERGAEPVPPAKRPTAQMPVVLHKASLSCFVLKAKPPASWVHRSGYLPPKHSELCPPGRARPGAGPEPQPWHTCVCGLTGSPRAQLALTGGKGSQLPSSGHSRSPASPQPPDAPTYPSPETLDSLGGGPTLLPGSCSPLSKFSRPPYPSSGRREHGVLPFLGQKCFVTKPSGSVNVCSQGCFAQLGQGWAEAPLSSIAFAPPLHHPNFRLNCAHLGLN